MSVPTFTSVPGPLVDVEDPCQLFNSFTTDDLIEMIVRETNRYVAICLESQSKLSVWTTSVNEIRSFLGFCILMGMNRLPATSDYWSTDPTFHYFPVASSISRTRFNEIKKYLHFVDNSSIPIRGEEGYNRLAKIQPVIDKVRTSFLSNYSPHCVVAIDEAIASSMASKV